MSEPIVRKTVMECGCVVTTKDHNIVDWKPKCEWHTKAFDNVLSSHDEWIEEQIFNEPLDPVK